MTGEEVSRGRGLSRTRERWAEDGGISGGLRSRSIVVSEHGPWVRQVGTVDVIGVLAAREDTVKKWQ